MELPKSYNIYNVDALNTCCESLAQLSDKENVQKWFRTTFKSWIRTQPAHLIRMVKREPSIEVILSVLPEKNRKAVEDSFFLIAVEPEEKWAQEALAKCELYYFRNSEVAEVTYGHWADYLATLPDGHISMTPEVVIEKVKAWDSEMEKVRLGDHHAGGMATRARALQVAMRQMGGGVNLNGVRMNPDEIDRLIAEHLNGRYEAMEHPHADEDGTIPININQEMSRLHRRRLQRQERDDDAADDDNFGLNIDDDDGDL